MYINMIRQIIILCLGTAMVSGLFGQGYIDATDLLPDSLINLQTVDVKSVDIDGDGDKDILLANEIQPNGILFNEENSFFAFKSVYGLSPLDQDSEDIAVGDFNRDSLLDMVFVNEDGIAHEYYFNRGNDSFSVAGFLPFIPCNAITSEDYNGDSIPDLFLATKGQNLLLLNDGSGNMMNVSPENLPNQEDISHDVKSGDLDLDGDVDLIIGNEQYPIFLINDGQGIFSDSSLVRLPLQLQNLDVRKIEIKDLNNDSFPDLYLSTVAFSPGADPQNKLWINDGRGYFSDSTELMIPRMPSQSLEVVTLDIEPDGDFDILVGGVQQNPFRIFVNNGSGNFFDRTNQIFGRDTIFKDSIDVLSIEVDDFDGDELEDIYIANRAGKHKLLLRNPVDPLDSLTNIGPNTFGNDVSYPEIFPNPGGVHRSIYFSPGKEIGEYWRLVDLKGNEKAISVRGNSSSSLYDLEIHEDLADGLYILSVQAGEKIISSLMIFQAE